MIKQSFIFLAFSFISTSLFFSCSKKKNINALSPIYKEEATSTAANPNTSNQTATGSVSIVNSATENSALIVGLYGWTNPTCISSGGKVLKGNNGNTKVTINFAATPVSGIYYIGNQPGALVCTMSVLNAPNQPSGINWIGKSGSIIVNNLGTSISATITNVVCTQEVFNFPTVGVSGIISCG